MPRRPNEKSASWRPAMLRRIDRVAFVVFAVVIGGSALWEQPPWRPAVTVRSCGGNFEMLCAFSRQFEREHGCRVSYTAAPVSFLLELALGDDAHLPDVLVGRSGPGWRDLERNNILAAPPRFFAVDPLVIVTPKGNPAQVRELNDLGRDGVRVVSAPYAMRPKGKVVAGLMAAVSDAFSPGLVDRWERNTVIEAKCGRLIGRAIAAGEADAAVTARSLTALPPLAGRCEIIAIPAKQLDVMKSGRGSIAQSVTRTTAHRERTLADRFVEELCAAPGKAVVTRYGYIPAGAAGYDEFAPFLKSYMPKPAIAGQKALAAQLEVDGVHKEVVRRYLYVIHVFGPSSADAETWYRIGDFLHRAGRTSAADAAWRRLVANHPTPGRKEWIDAPDTDERWAARARGRLDDAATPAVAWPDWLQRVAVPPFMVRDADPPKGARRFLAVAADLVRLGDYEYAVRDALKVVTLHHPSPQTPAALALAGAALYLRNDVAAARPLWQRVCADYSESPWAGPCGEALAWTQDQVTTGVTTAATAGVAAMPSFTSSPSSAVTRKYPRFSMIFWRK